MIRSYEIIFVENAFNIKEMNEPSHKFFMEVHKEEDKAKEPQDPRIVTNEYVRPQRIRRLPDRLNILTGDWWKQRESALVAAVDIEEPKTIEEALNGVKSKLWSDALCDEFNLLKEN